ncbi:MAG: hypothetical protein J4G05_09545 [Chlorobi bacterium]|nr:hypothetical protein [Chlorobiota bacterium]
MTKRDLEIPEAIFERRNRQNSWIISILFHLVLLLPLFLITCSPSTEPEDLTLIEWGGGGNPDVNAPVGPAPKGEPDGGEQNSQEQNEQSEDQPDVIPPQTNVPDKISQPDKQDSKPNNQQTESSTENSTSSSEQANAPDNPKGNPEAEGKDPASGSGSITASGFGLGAGRHWIRHPRSTISKSSLSGETGTVVVSYAVKWDGQISNIRKVSGNTRLFLKIRGALAQARANRGDPGSPDIRGTGSYTVN